MYYLALKRVNKSRYFLYVKLKHKVIDILATLDYDFLTKNIVIKYYFYKVRYWVNKLRLDSDALFMFEKIYEQKLKIKSAGLQQLGAAALTNKNLSDKIKIKKIER